MSIKARFSGRRDTIGRTLLALAILAIALSAPAMARTKLSLQPVSVTKNSLTIAADPRIELISIVQYLSDYRKLDPSLVTRLDHSYRKEVDAWFSGSKNHPVIAMFDRMAANNFAYDAPPHTVLYLNPDLTLNEVIIKDYPAGEDRAGGKEQLLAFTTALKAFAVESGFPEFYKNHIPFYKKITRETIDKTKDENVVKQLEDYCGEKKRSYTVIISPLLGVGAFGPQVERKKGEKEVYCIMGPGNGSGDTPTFGSAEYFHQLQWHEFGHSFINPLVNKHMDLWQKHSNLFPPIESIMDRQAYGYWNVVGYESLLRAMTTRLAYRVSGREAGDKELRSHEAVGFVFTRALTKKLEEYEANRTKYPTLESFFPELLSVLDGFSESSVKDILAGAEPTLNDTFMSAKSLVYEVPDADGKDDAVKYIERMHEAFLSKREMIDATELDEAALKGKLRDSFVLYTTIGSRLFNAATEPLNIRIDGGTLHWNGVDAPVNELRIILVGKNPYGDGNCVVYAGGSNKLLDGINGCFHGKCSYHIFKDKQLLKEGFYNKRFVISEGQ